MRIGYCRVSTKEQSERTNALKQQKDRVSMIGVERIIVDVESSYKDKYRQGLNELMSLVKMGLVHEVVITRLDRLGRSVLELNKIVQEMQKYKCVLRALDDNINLDTVDGRLHFNLLASFAQSESDRLSERIKHGMEHRRANLMPQTNIPFGYLHLDGKYILDTKPYLCTIKDKIEHSKYQISTDIVLIYLSVKSVAQTQEKMLDYYGHSMLTYDGYRYWLNNLTLDGHTVYKNTGQIHYNTHRGIISPCQRREIELTKKQSSYTRRHTKGKIYPFSGKVVCGDCGGNCIIINSIHYFCSNRRSHKINCNNGKQTSIERIEKGFIGELLRRSESLLQLIAQESIEVDTPELLKLRSQRDALLLIPNNSAIDKAIKDIEKQIYNLEHNTYSKIHNKKLTAVLSSPLFWETLNSSDKKNIVWLLVDKILVLDGNILSIQFKE